MTLESNIQSISIEERERERVSYQICYQYPKQKDTHYSDFGMNATGVLTDSLSNSIYTPLAIIMHAFHS